MEDKKADRLISQFPSNGVMVFDDNNTQDKIQKKAIKAGFGFDIKKDNFVVMSKVINGERNSIVITKTLANLRKGGVEYSKPLL